MKHTAVVLAFVAQTSVVGGLATVEKQVGKAIYFNPRSGQFDESQTDRNVATSTFRSVVATLLGPFGGMAASLPSVSTETQIVGGVAESFRNVPRIVGRPFESSPGTDTVGLHVHRSDATFATIVPNEYHAPDHTLPAVFVVFTIFALIFAVTYLQNTGMKKLQKRGAGTLLRPANSDEEEFVAFEVDIDHDVYGAAIYSIIHDGWDLVTNVDHDNLWRSSNIYHLGFCMSIMIANYVLQLSILYFTYQYVVYTGMDRVQDYISDFQKECYTSEKMFNQTAWQAYDGQEQICSIVFTYFWFTLLILMLWVGVMLKEGRHTERMYRNIRDIPSIDDYDDDMYEIDEERGISRVVRLGPILRTTLYATVVIPKLCISVVLLFLGLQWLTSTMRFTNLVLNSVSLGFIVKIDELLYEALMPASTHHGIENFKLAPRRASDRNSDVVWGYMRSTIYFALMLLLPYAWLTLGQDIPGVGVFPGFDRAGIQEICYSWRKAQD